MRMSRILAAVLTAAPMVSAAGTFGYNLGTQNPDASCKSQSDYESDLDAIASNSGLKLVRGYSASDCDSAEYMLAAAKNKGFQVILGIWPDVDSSFNADLAACEKYGEMYPDQLYGIIVGSETLYRGTFTGAELLEKINTVKQAMPSVRVGTADTWNKFYDGTADVVIKGKPDMLMVNAFSFWQGMDISNATLSYFDDVMRAFGYIQSIVGTTSSIELWTGETGWPSTTGNDYENAQGGLENAKYFYHDAACGMIGWGYNVLYFEAFDETWKPAAAGTSGKTSDERSWGVMTDDRSPKFDLYC